MSGLSERRHGSDVRPGFRVIGDAAEYTGLAHSAMTAPYRALSAAVTHCDRAFVARANVIVGLERAQARAVAETLALETLRRAAAFRKERRRLWRAERRNATTPAVPRPQKERRLLVELRRAASTTAPAQGSSARAAGCAGEFSDLYADAVIRARDAANAARSFPCNGSATGA